MLRSVQAPPLGRRCAPALLLAKGFPIVTSLLFVALSFLDYPVGSLLSLPLVECLGRKVLVVVAGLEMAVFGLLFRPVRRPRDDRIVRIPLHRDQQRVLSNAFHISQAEIFPTRLHATAASSTYSLSRLSNALLPFILLPVLAMFGPVTCSR